MSDFNHEEELTRQIEPVVQNMTPIQRVVSLFASPGKLMENIKEHPVILAPFIIAVVLSLISIPLSAPFTIMVGEEINRLMIERMLELGIDASEFIAATAGGYYGDAPNAFGGMNIGFVSLINAAAGPVIASAISAAGYWILTKIFRGRATFSQYFSMYMHLMILTGALGLITFSAAIAIGRPVDITSLAALIMPHGNMSMLSFNILSVISLASIWSAVLTFVGIKTFNDFGNGKSIAIASIMLVLAVALAAVMMTMPFFIFS